MRLGSLGARTAAVAAGLVCTTTCQITDALRPGALKNVVLGYAGDTVLVVAAPLTPQVTVTVDGSPLAGARLAFVSSDTGIVAVHGDTLVPKSRGVDTLTISLVSSALPANPPSVRRALLVVADTVTLDSSAVHFSSLGDSVTLLSTARDAVGAAMPGVTCRWSSSDTTVVALAPVGHLTAKGNGTATVRAMVDRDTAMVTVTVAQQLAHWTFNPASLTIAALTDTATVVATGHDPRGSPIAGLAPASWTVGDASIVTASAGGLVTSARNGSTFLYALRGGVRDSLPVTVAQRATSVAITPRPVPPITSLGGQAQLTARAFDRRGIEIQAASPVWFTLEPGSVQVSNAGLVTALAIGTAHVVASLDAGADTAAISISNSPVTLTVLPDSATATSLGDTLVFRAVARNGRGDSVAAIVSWRTPDSTIVTLLSDGRAIALAVGTARLIASVGSTADTGLAKVTNVPASVDITPAAVAFTSLGDVDTVPVTVKNARGAALARGAVTWTSDDATIAKVSTSGVITAVDTGQTVVRATSGALYDSALVTVQNLPATMVVNNPAVDTLTAIGQALVLPVDVRNARGVSIANYPVAWQSTNRAAVDTVLPTGAALAIGWGSTALIARAGAIADTVRLAVVNPTRLYVSNALFTGLRVGTYERPYAKIQDAVNAADAGDTVVVLRGVGGYSESVALARRVTILGDSAAYVSGGRNPSLLPLLAHDTGAAAITAVTTAPVALRYLAIRHTLDGAAFSGNGSDVDLQWLYVNPPGTVTTRIGRGVLVANSQAGSNLINLRIRSVRGYGVSLVNSSTATVASDSIIGVDSIGIPEGGAGISLRGGAAVSLTANVIRATHGPRILVRGPASATITNHTLSGWHPLIQIDSVTGLVNIQNNTFQVGWDSYDASDSPDCDVDARCAGVLITDSRNGSLVSGAPGAWLYYTSPVDIRWNTFYNVNYPGTVGTGIGIRVRRSEAYAAWNTFSNMQVGTQLDGSSKAVVEGGTVDTTSWASWLTDVDSIYLLSITGSEAGLVYKSTLTSAGTPWIATMGTRFSRRTGNIVNIFDTGAYAQLSQSYFTSAPNAQPILFWGWGLQLYTDTVSATGDTVANGYRGGIYYTGAVAALFASNVWLQNSVITGYTSFPGLLFYGSSPGGSLGFSATQSIITENQIGLKFDGIPASASFWSTNDNAVYDNTVGGLLDTRSSGSNLTGWWWGDARGPRGGANLAATGDSVLAAPFAPSGILTAPPFTGSVAAGLRQVRGTGQTAAHGTTLPKALTARVVDALGLPVPGVSVTFTVAGGGGNLAGQLTQTVSTNGDGLAEVSWTLGGSPGANTVSATGTGLNTLYFAATGT